MALTINHPDANILVQELISQVGWAKSFSCPPSSLKKWWWATKIRCPPYMATLKNA